MAGCPPLSGEGGAGQGAPTLAEGTYFPCGERFSYVMVLHNCSDLPYGRVQKVVSNGTLPMNNSQC